MIHGHLSRTGFSTTLTDVTPDTTLIQLAWLWLRYQPGSALAAWFRERVGALQGRTRRIAIVAMARKLLIVLWRYVETGVLPEGIEIRPQVAAAA